MGLTRRTWRVIAATGWAIGLAGCAVAPPAVSVGQTPWATPDPHDVRGAATWEEQRFPGKAVTRYRYEVKDGRDALAVLARSSASMKRQRLQVPPEALGTLSFAWHVPALVPGADMGRRDTEDSAVRVVLVFEGDRSRFSPRDAMLSELARSLTGEPMPYATLMYVWCAQRPVGTIIENPRTSRIRKLVVESGPSQLGRWRDYQRDIRADYERAFGEPPGALVGIGVMSDTDNTRTEARAWYGRLRLSAALAGE